MVRIAPVTLHIEHIDMIDELEKIIDIPYIDGFIFGPNDLSASTGDMLNVFFSENINAIKKAVDILKAHNKAFAFAVGTNEEDLKKWAEFQPDMIFSGADWCFLYNQGKETLNTLKKILK